MPLPCSAWTAVSTKEMIDADGSDFDLQIADAELVEEFLLDGLARFGAEAANAFVGIVAGERGQVHASDGAEKPGDLPIFFHRAAGDRECRRGARRRRC